VDPPLVVAVAHADRPRCPAALRTRQASPPNTGPDRFVAKFFDDLSDDVRQLTGAALPGFMDQGMAVGTRWSDQLSEALGTCRVFVALLSPSYIASHWCGWNGRRSQGEG
jgi:hypothetical protein